ncbi:porin family protein [Nonlabens sp. Ci31]|jgi:opacity protein-like surface antigen|uniref:outer membrane beta-barrel protein n=1 Tax=Nonlabens sp. Ci31 TaxID=2608253 RepID=UPI0014628AFE|nr:outer membrane beta-barrel protein [Nonlabens sp. Ci31]QJP33107.1 porin family protein [Nonlabens sp. Ci31]
MKIKFILSTLVVLGALHFTQAQEELPNSTNYLFEFEEPVDRWETGLSLQALVGFREIKTQGRINDRYDQIWIGAGVGFYADYKLNKVWKLRAEAGVNAYIAFDPYINLQTEFKFSNRWSFYAGAGTFFNMDADHMVQLDERGLTVLNPYVQLGLRYKMSKNWTMDLRYQQDLLARQRATDFNNFTKTSPLGTFSLGFNYRF